MMAIKLFVNLLIVFFSTEFVYSFPDTIRHGYTNCSSCHVSPSGGGLLNGYGRSLSRELMSTWSYKNEEQPLHGLAPIPESVIDSFFVGGDSRYVVRKTENANKKVDEGFLMQAQMRLGLAYRKLKFIAAFGKIENPRQSKSIRLVSPEYYLLWNPKEEIHFRAGRFEPIYGLRLPDHNLWIKSEIGFVPWAERDVVETIYEGESQFISLSGFQSTSAVTTAEQYTGYSLSLNLIIFETSRIGVSAMNSEGQGRRQRTTTAHGTFSFSEKSYLMSELGRILMNDSSSEVSFVRYGYELKKGFTPIIQVQTRKTPDNNQSRYGLGFIWLPRPHFEFMGIFEQNKNAQESSNESALLMHYYF